MTGLSWAPLMGGEPIRSGDSIFNVAPQVESAPAAPDFVFGPVPASLNRFYNNETVVHPVAAVSLREGGVAGDGFPVRDGTFLTAPAYGLSADYITMRLQGRTPPVQRIEPGRAVVLSAPGYLIYGHWLVDILPKLHLIDRMGLDLRRETLAMPADTPPFGASWLRLLGIEPQRVVTYHPADEIVTFEELVLPLPLRANSRASALFLPAVQWLWEQMATAAVPSPVGSERLYLSRQRSGRTARQLMDAAALEAVARNHGYSIVHPEQFTLAQQVGMFRSARFMIGEYGSALHGSIFARPECIVCALRGTAIDPGFLQSGLCQVMGQRFGYVFGSTDETGGGTQRFSVDPQDLDAALRLMAIMGKE